MLWGSAWGDGSVQVSGGSRLGRSSGVGGSREPGRGSGESEGVGFTTNLQWSGVTSPCVLRPWSKRNQENYLMRSCRGREWGHGVRSLGGFGGGEPGGQSRGEKSMGGQVSRTGGRETRGWGREGSPKSWLEREGGQLGAGAVRQV